MKSFTTGLTIIAFVAGLFFTACKSKQQEGETLQKSDTTSTYMEPKVDKTGLGEDTQQTQLPASDTLPTSKHK